MGGIVATSLLPSKSQDISVIMTMSTPHTLPPARFDYRIDDIYSTIQHTLLSDPTPILSLCGGATDMMIPSESCVLPELEVQNHAGRHIYRKSVFTSALEGAWTGVGHREMVWCHQVRWRLARAALELGAAVSATEKGLVLDKWLRDGHTVSHDTRSMDQEISLTDPKTYEMLSVDVPLVLRNPRSPRMYLLPVSQSPNSSLFVLYVSQGSVRPISPQNSFLLRACVYLCSAPPNLDDDPPKCTILVPVTLKLIPNPIPGKTFPVPDEGSDESEGVVLLEADVPPLNLTGERRWVGVLIENADGRGWVVGGMNMGKEVKKDVGVLSLFP
jgi:glycosylphosphatidylinositol deacylase